MPKRAGDITGAALALLVLCPILIAVALAVRALLGRPILFRQMRPGYREEPFLIHKFRTMRKAVDPQGYPLPDGERLHPFGNFLRRASLDELPELWNVLRGDMSLVGPRPLLLEYLPRYNDSQRRRHEVKPGITGWAQVNGRNALTWEEKFDLDVWYVDHQTFWLDVKILWLTVLKVLRREGISHAGHATMPEFAAFSEPPLPTQTKR
jgi:lipopolysaccharide/colanic/teichoic acid biosynthesis glycosyltransferase